MSENKPSEELVPVVLLSYSHDSPAHKKWVGLLATKLMANRIDVILDQWETGPGDDLPKFMERSVSRADRVLMVCTEAYVHKADDGKGGVGYEAMIVTGELVKDLGTRKFIPIIRQRNGRDRKPKFLETRYHINLSETQNFDNGFEELLRELHKAPVLPKPKLGQNPFQKDVQRMSDEGASSTFRLTLKLPDDAQKDAGLAYDTALEVARRNDTLGWRKFTQKIASTFPGGLLDWQKERENNLPTSVEDLPQLALEGISFCAPMIAIALAGVESQQPQFSNQIGLIDEFLQPSGWQRSGSTILVDFPELAVFVYQALLGGVAMQTGQPDIAYRLATTEIPDLYSPNKSGPLFLQSGYTGWPQTLNHTVTIAWKFIMQLPEQWPWLSNIFGSADNCKASIGSYYMFLNVIEFLDAVNRKLDLSDPKHVTLTVPICYASTGDDTQRKALRYFKECLPYVSEQWNIPSSTHEARAEMWNKWMAVKRHWLASVYRNGYGWHRETILLANLPHLITGSTRG
jgi:hypothetical protein